ncbi:MAG: hypothetical protein VW443_02420 [Pseudomonadales bacterium]
MQIAPSYRSFCGETFISWDDGIVWERVYDHEPQDTYYHGEAREFVWNVLRRSGFNWLALKSGITALMPGHFTPKYGNDYGELANYFTADYLGYGYVNGTVQRPLNSDGTHGAAWGEPAGYGYASPLDADVRALIAGAAWKASQASGDMYPHYSPVEIHMKGLNCGGCDFGHYVDTTYQWNQQWCQPSGWMADTLPVETENWTTDPNYPLGESGITAFAHEYNIRFIYSPSVITHLETDCKPWGINWHCDECDEPTYYGRHCGNGCPEDWEYDDEEAVPPRTPCKDRGCKSPCPPKRVVDAAMQWSQENRDSWSQGTLRYTTYNQGTSPYFSCGNLQGMSVGDEFQRDYSQRQAGIWSGNAEWRKSYHVMPCQPVARHYTNVRSLPDPASLDGVEEYTVDNVGVAHRWVWSHEDQQWYEHGKIPEPDGGVI